MRRAGLILCLAACRLAAVELQPLVHVDLRGGLAGVQGQQQTPLAQGEFFAVPALQFTDRTSLTPSLYFVGGGQERSLEEQALFVRTASVGFRPQVKLHQEGDSLWTLTGDLRHAYNVEAVNESVGLGLYDYEDYSLALGWDSKFQDVPAGVSARLSRRGYPNYHNLASEQYGGKDFYIKDFVGGQGEAHADLGPLGHLGASVELRNYPDAYVTSAVDGLVDLGQNQRDVLENVGLGGGRGLTPALALGWNLGWQASQSNQNVFDSSQATPVGLPHADDYSAYIASVSAQWKPGQTWSLLGSYTANFRNFNRPIQEPDASYTQGSVAEVEHDLSLGLRWPLGPGWAAVAGADAQFLLSNQEYAAAGVPSYNYYSGTAGIQWDWKTGN